MIALGRWSIEQFIDLYNDLAENAFGSGAKLAAYHLQMFGVMPERQRQGIGRALIEFVEEKVCRRVSVGLPEILFLKQLRRRGPSMWTCAWKA